VIQHLTEMPWSIGIGLLISIIIAYVAYRRRALDATGLVAAVVTGTIIFAFGGWYFMAVLMVFFVSSSLLSKLHPEAPKDSMRNYKQVLANGSIGMILAVLFYVHDDAVYRTLYTISFAVATADTWGGEIGRLSKTMPRQILTWRQVEPGVSGGVTLLGTLASLAGSMVIALLLSFRIQVIVWGLLGSIVDSVLGTVQIKYVTASGRVLDTPPEEEDVRRTTGIRFLTNNLVNFLSNLIIVIAAYLFLQIT